MQLLKLLHGLTDFIPERYLAHFSSGSLDDAYASSGVQIIEIKRGRGSKLQKLRNVMKQLKCLTINIRPDVVHTQLPQTNILTCFALWNLDVPILVSERGLGRSRPLWEKLVRASAYKRADLFVTNTNAIRQRLLSRERVASDMIRCVPNIIEYEEPRDTNRTWLCNELKFPTDSVIIASVGGLRAVKGYHTLLEAFALLHSIRRETKLLIIGDGPYRQQLTTMIESAGLVDDAVLLGHRNDVHRVLKASDFYVSASLSEGQSNAILEAMLYGLPVVATSVGGTSDLIEDGYNGLLVNVNSPIEIFTALQALISDKNKSNELGRHARISIGTNHTMKAVTQMYIDIYLDTIRRHRGICES